MKIDWNYTFSGELLGETLSKYTYFAQHTVYDYVIGANIIFFVVVIILSIFSIQWHTISVARPYLGDINDIFSLYIALYLMARFNRFRSVTFTDLDRKMVFHAGLLLFLNLLLGAYLALWKTIEEYAKKAAKLL